MKAEHSTKQKEALQKEALQKIYNLFNRNWADVSRAAGVSTVAVYQWKVRGCISASAAIKLETHPTVKGKLRKEDMRPDVDDWWI